MLPSPWKLDAGFALLAALFAALGLRLWAVQIRGHADAAREQDSQAWGQEDVEPPRGDILDARGELLAISQEAPSCFVDPKFLENPEAAATALAATLHLDRAALLDRIRKARRFVWVKRRVSPEEEAAVRALKLRGVGFDRDVRRAYPRGESLGQILGYVDIDGRGLEGLEKGFQATLAGASGERWVLRDARRDMIASFSRETRAARPGFDLVLTVDARIQAAADAAVAHVVEKHSPESAVAVVMDPRTGDILALSGFPSYDPNAPAAAKPEARRCRAATDFWEPGSTFKGVVMAALMEKGLVKPSEMIQCEGGAWTYRGRRITDVHGYGALSVEDVLVKSSNIGMAKMVSRIPAKDLETWVRAFGFGQATGAGIPGESPGTMPRERPWAPQTCVSVSFGYAVGATPLQLAAAYCAIANGGTAVRPRLVRAAVAPDGRELDGFAPAPGNRLLSPKVCRDLVTMMIQVVERGTGKSAKQEGFLTAGKTGTTKLLGPDGKYAAGKYASSFVGFAPARDPRLLVLVLVKEPQGAYYGGTVAAPAVGEILKEGLALLEVKPDPAGVKAQRDAWAKKK
jgi:cell division protein FtsI (penicillin-binding protein 3)